MAQSRATHSQRAGDTFVHKGAFVRRKENTMAYFPFIPKPHILSLATHERREEYQKYLGRKPELSAIQRQKNRANKRVERVHRRAIDTLINSQG